MTGTVDGVDRLVTVSELQRELQLVYETYGGGGIGCRPPYDSVRGREVEFR
jgi:hypothetical protein